MAAEEVLFGTLHSNFNSIRSFKGKYAYKNLIKTFGGRTSSQAPSYASPKLSLTHLRTGVRCRATSVAKNWGPYTCLQLVDLIPPEKSVLNPNSSSCTHSAPCWWGLQRETLLLEFPSLNHYPEEKYKSTRILR